MTDKKTHVLCLGLDFVKCIVCKCIIPVSDGTKGLGIDPRSNAWDGGVVDAISAGFGSKFDTISYCVAICDDCVEDALIDGRIFQSTSNMYP